MDNIKIVRLKTGEDVIADIAVEEFTMKIMNPMNVIFKRLPTGKAMMMMIPWIPMEIVEYNYTEIHNEDVLSVFEPKQALIAYYKHSIEDLYKRAEEESSDIENSLMSDEEEYSDEDIESFEDSLEDYVDNLTTKRIIH